MRKAEQIVRQIRTELGDAAIERIVGVIRQRGRAGVLDLNETVPRVIDQRSAGFVGREIAVGVKCQGCLPDAGDFVLHVVRAGHGGRAGGLRREVAHHVEGPGLRARRGGDRVERTARNGRG